VLSGLDSMAAGKCEPAIRQWTRTWTGEDAAKVEQLVASCAYFGRMGTIYGYDLLRTLDVTPNLQRVYVVLRAELEPVYVMILAYSPDGTHWKIAGVNWNTDPDKIVPRELLPPQSPGS
jgi:hypothetical protein